MSIRYGILALLRRGPMHGYQLRTAFEESTGGTWPINIGQIYTTLGRLERDGLVQSLPESDTGQRPYELTGDGETDLASWFSTPIERAERPRDELAIKMSLALTTPGVDVRMVVQAQRTATMRALQQYTRLKPSGADPKDLPWTLVLDALLFQAEAEIRWLDHCESRLTRNASQTTSTPASPTNRATRPAGREMSQP